MARKIRKFSEKEKVFQVLVIILVIIALPLTLILVEQVQENRSIAATADKLETEGGTLSSTGVTAQSDSQASGGQYVLFSNATLSPTPTSLPSPTPSQGSWGPRPAPTTPTGSGVFTVPSGIDGSGNSDVSSAMQSFINSVPSGTSSNPSIIVFPAGKTYQLVEGILLQDKNNITFWGYGNKINITGLGTLTRSSAFRLRRTGNIKMFGFRIIGSDPDITNLNSGQNQHGVNMSDDVDNTEVADMHISNVHGDGIMLFTFDKPACNNWNFHHNLLENIGRQGITINEGNGRIEYNIIKGTGMYSVDAEDQGIDWARSADGSNKNLGPVVIANNWFDGWEYYDDYAPKSLAFGYSAEDMETMHDFTIENNLFTRGDVGTRSPYFGTRGIFTSRGSLLKTNIVIRNNTFDVPDNQNSGWAVELNNVNGGQVTNNTIQDMTIHCTTCTNVNISNNN